MNKINFVAPIPLFIFMLCSFLSCTSSDYHSGRGWMYSDTAGHEFRFRMKTDKSEYVFGEDVKVTFNIQNTGEKTDTISATFFTVNYLTQKMKCVRDGTDTSKWTGVEASYSKKDYIILRPGEEYSTADNLNANQGNIGLFYRNYFRTGDYKAVCGYWFVSPSMVSSKYAVSNSIEFKVCPASDSVTAMFNELYDTEKRLEAIRRGPGSVRDYIDSAMVSVRKYAASKLVDYLFFSCYLNRDWFNYKYDETLIEDMDFYIGKNPDSDFNRTLVWDCVQYFMKKDIKEAGRDFLIGLKNKYGNAKLDGFVDEALGKYEEWRK